MGWIHIMFSFFLIFWLFFKKVSTFIEYAIRSTIKTCCCWCCCNYSQKQRTKQKIWRRKKIIHSFQNFSCSTFAAFLTVLFSVLLAFLCFDCAVVFFFQTIGVIIFWVLCILCLCCMFLMALKVKKKQTTNDSLFDE